MSGPQRPEDPQSEALQFDRADDARPWPTGVFCRECLQPLRDEYYDVGGDVICPTCLADRRRLRSRLGRGFKAMLFGSVAAAVGAGIDRMITTGTGWNLSLVAVLVGYVVGGAVRTGSGERGGRLYQLLAVFLTYSAIVGMFLPDVWRVLNERPRGGQEVGKANGDDRKAVLEKAADAKARADAPRNQARPGEGGRRRPPAGLLGLAYILGMLCLASLVLVGLMYAIPVVVGMNSPISLLIFGVALWQAWIMNRPSEGPVTGPYRVRG